MGKPFKIGVWIDKEYVPESGGGYSFLTQMISGIDQKDFSSNLEICFIGFNLNNHLPFKKNLISIPFTESFFEKKRTNFYHKIFKSVAPRRDIQLNYLGAEQLLKSKKIDLILYLTQNKFIENYPFIIVHWDLGHKTTYPFPEMAMHGNWEYRDDSLRKNLNKALLIATESQRGKEEIIKNYNVFEKKIRIMPLFPGKMVDDEIIAKRPKNFDEKSRFFVYPAQFWAHKNHYNLIVAFEKMLSENENLKLILPGSEQGSQSYIKELIDKLGISKSVIMPGFISDKELKWCYQHAIGLVFPSFLGPTNMPLLEANYLNCNIACSNLAGHKEMLGNNSIFFEPENPNSILEAMKILLEYDRIGKKISVTDLSKTFSLKNSLQILEDIFEESINIRRTWHT